MPFLQECKPWWQHSELHSAKLTSFRQLEPWRHSSSSEGTECPSPNGAYSGSWTLTKRSPTVAWTSTMSQRPTCTSRAQGWHRNPWTTSCCRSMETWGGLMKPEPWCCAWHTATLTMEVRHTMKNAEKMAEAGALWRTTGLKMATSPTTSTPGMRAIGTTAPGTMRLPRPTTRTGLPSTMTTVGMMKNLNKLKVMNTNHKRPPLRSLASTSKEKAKAVLRSWDLDAAPVDRNGTTRTLARWTTPTKARTQRLEKGSQKASTRARANPMVASPMANPTGKATASPSPTARKDTCPMAPNKDEKVSGWRRCQRVTTTTMVEHTWWATTQQQHIAWERREGQPGQDHHSGHLQPDWSTSSSTSSLQRPARDRADRYRGELQEAELPRGWGERDDLSPSSRTTHPRTSCWSRCKQWINWIRNTQRFVGLRNGTTRQDQGHHMEWSQHHCHWHFRSSRCNLDQNQHSLPDRIRGCGVHCRCHRWRGLQLPSTTS